MDLQQLLRDVINEIISENKNTETQALLRENKNNNKINISRI